jgi:hypothetical protein
MGWDVQRIGRVLICLADLRNFTKTLSQVSVPVETRIGYFPIQVVIPPESSSVLMDDMKMGFWKTLVCVWTELSYIQRRIQWTTIIIILIITIMIWPWDAGAANELHMKLNQKPHMNISYWNWDDVPYRVRLPHTHHKKWGHFPIIDHKKRTYGRKSIKKRAFK